jgi:hypothetical protein
MRVHAFTFLLFLLSFQLGPIRSSAAQEQPKQAVDVESDTSEESDELEQLRREAEGLTTDIEDTVDKDKTEPETIFTSGQRSLQALNPEISVVIDAGGMLILHDFDSESLEDDSRFYFRVMGLHFESNLDPFSFFKAAVEVSPEGVGLGEAYVTWVNVLPSVNLTLGKFRQQFGVIQRWHVPSLDQFAFPLPLTTVLGPEGLNQIGFSLDWRLPELWAHDQHLILQVTNGMNEHLFSGQKFGVPVGLLRWTQYFDLSGSTYLEFGLTGMLGANSKRNTEDENGLEIDEPWRTTTVAGADLTLSWSPLNRERYRHVTWRSEFYWAGKETPEGYLAAGGGYSYLDVGLSEAWVIGARGDLTQPFAVDNESKWLWQVVGYVTWWQSPWVKARIQLSHLDGDDRTAEQRLIVQFVFAAGPHKHERY